MRPMMRQSLLHSAEPHLIGRVCTLLPQVQKQLSGVVGSNHPAALLVGSYTCAPIEAVSGFQSGRVRFLSPTNISEKTPNEETI